MVRWAASMGGEGGGESEVVDGADEDEEFSFNSSILLGIGGVGGMIMTCFWARGFFGGVELPGLNWEWAIERFINL